MLRLKVREFAEAQGLNMSQLQRRSQLTMGVIRRYWYNTVDGKEQGPPLEMVSLRSLQAMASVLGVTADSLIVAEETQEGIFSRAMLVAA